MQVNVKTHDGRELAEHMTEMYKKKRQYEQAKAEYEQTKTSISRKLDRFTEMYGVKKVTFVYNDVNLAITEVKKKERLWNIPLLNKLFKKDIYRRVVQETFYIKNMDEFIERMMSLNIEPSHIKDLIGIDRVVDEKEFDKLVETGEIDGDNAKKVYKVREKSKYYRFVD